MNDIVEVIGGLVEDDHVVVMLELRDGNLARYVLPIELVARDMQVMIDGRPPRPGMTIN